MKLDEPAHTREEMEACLAAMREVTANYYQGAIKTGSHPFIEFCGMMNEYIVVCQETMESGGDFMESNTHTGKPLLMREHHARYLAEKFDCIFGPTLRADPEVCKTFLLEIRG